MFALKFLFKVVRLMNSETSAASLAAAFVLGMFLGLVPMITLQWLLALLVVAFLRVNLTATVFTLIAFKLASLGLQGPFDGLGAALLSAEGLTGLWSFLANAPVLSFLYLNNAVVLGSTLASLALSAPLFFLWKFLIRKYRRHVREWIRRSKVLAFARGFLLFRLYRGVTRPLG